MGNAACNSIRGVAGHTHTTTRPHIDFSCENGCPAANWTIKDSHSPHCKLRPTVNNGNRWWCGWWLQGCAARVATETALAIAHIALIANFGSWSLRLYNYIYIIPKTRSSWYFNIWNTFSIAYGCIQIMCVGCRCALSLAYANWCRQQVRCPHQHHHHHHPYCRHQYTFRNCRENVDGFTYISLRLPCSDNHIMAISDEQPTFSATCSSFLPPAHSAEFSVSIAVKMYCLLIGACGWVTAKE